MTYYVLFVIAMLAIYAWSLHCKDSGMFARLTFALAIGLLVGAGVINVKTIYLLNTITAEKVDVVDVTRMVKDASSTCTEEPLKEETISNFNEELTQCMGQKQVLRDTATFDTERTFPPQEPEIQNDS